jgi:hypothetical protein
MLRRLEVLFANASQLDGSSPSVDGILLEILPKALDRDTFHIARDKIGAEYKDQIDLSIDQNPPNISSPTKESPSQGRSICILDRTGEIKVAVESIMATRTSPYYTSPYSPDLILVNEYLKEEFIARCLEYESQVDQSDSLKTATSDNPEFQKMVKQAEVGGEVLIHKRNTNFTIVELKNRYGAIVSSQCRNRLTVNLDLQSSQPSKLQGAFFSSSPQLGS